MAVGAPGFKGPSRGEWASALTPSCPKDRFSCLEGWSSRLCPDCPSDGECSVGIRQGSNGSQTLSSALADEGVLGFFCRLTEPVQLGGKALLAGTSLTTSHTPSCPCSWPVKDEKLPLILKDMSWWAVLPMNPLWASVTHWRT